MGARDQRAGPHPEPERRGASLVPPSGDLGDGESTQHVAPGNSRKEWSGASQTAPGNNKGGGESTQHMAQGDSLAEAEESAARAEAKANRLLREPNCKAMHGLEIMWW